MHALSVRQKRRKSVSFLLWSRHNEVMCKLKRDQRGLITMELFLLIIFAVIIYFIYKKVQSAQH